MNEQITRGHNPDAEPSIGHERPEGAYDETSIWGAPTPHDLGLTINPDLSWEDINIAQPTPFDLGWTNDEDLSWEGFQAECEGRARTRPEAEREAGE